MLDGRTASPVASDADTFCPVGLAELRPQWLTVAAVVALRGPRGASADADERAVRRMLARWHRLGADPRTGFPYPRTMQRERADGRGLEWVVRADDLAQYFPAWANHA